MLSLILDLLEHHIPVSGHSYFAESYFMDMKFLWYSF